MTFETQKERLFVTLSCILSIIHSIGYVWHGFQIGFNHCIIAMIICDVLYIPAIIIRNGRFLFPYFLIYTAILVLITAFTTSRLYNNYSGLLCIFLCILIFPQYKHYMMWFYLGIASISFVLNGAPAYYLVIHASRTLWVFIIYDAVIYNLYNRKPVILYEDEKRILEQLSDDKYLKEVELDGLSDRTIRRKLEKALKRNGIEHRKDLIQLYKDTYKQNAD